MNVFFKWSAAAFLSYLTTGAFAAEPAFHWNFNGTGNSVSQDGKIIAPLSAKHLNFSSGISGEALELSQAPTLLFDSKDMFASKGTLSFWFMANHSGHSNPAVQHILDLKLKGGKEFPLGWFHIYEGLSFRLPREKEQMILKSKISGVHSLQKGDWVHIAVSWGDSNWATVYLNGVATEWKRFSGIDFSPAIQLAIGQKKGSGNSFQGRIDELKIFKRALSPKEIFAEYTKYAMIDAYLDQTLFSSDKRIRIPVGVAPVGTLHGNNPQATGRVIPFKGAVVLSLKDEKGKVLAERKWRELSIVKPEKLLLPETNLPAGIYRIELETVSDGRKMCKYFDIAVDQLKLNISDKEDVAFGKPFFSASGKELSASKTISSGKLNGFDFAEGGMHKGDRLFCEVSIPEQYASGQLLCMEIEWPDDKARAMGIYLYPPKGTSQIRDRIGGGIYTGEEYPVSGKMQKTKYLFHAAYKNYLVEVRTMISGKPAAVAGITISPVEGPLPRLKINLPEGLPGRKIGHLDEDQSFDYNLDWDNTRKLNDPWKIQAKAIRLLLEYYAYTGQNLFTLPVMRYSWTDFPRIYSTGKSMGPLNHAGYWLDRLSENKIEFIAIVNMMNVPELENQRLKAEYKRKGLTSASVDGPIVGLRRNNPIHPENRKMLLKNMAEFMARLGNRPEVSGIDFWTTWNIVSFSDLDSGYDDYTVSAFSRETGVKIPEFQDDIYRARHKFLTAEPIRQKWVGWRTDKTTEILKAIRVVIDKECKEKPLYISVNIPCGENEDEAIDGLDIAKYLYEEKGIDLKALKSIPNTFVIPNRDSLKQIWKQHWNGAIVVSDEAMNNRKYTEAFRHPKRNAVNSYRTYFETFSTSPMQDKYPSVFQNVELKPVGRYFLKELCFALAFNDAQQIVIGAQPLVSMGCETEMREFVKAYRALPDLPFQDVPGAEDPVTVRFLHTKNGTYLYAVNLIPSDLTVKLNLGMNGMVRNLSNETSVEVKSKELEIRLKPFELCSFLISGTAVPTLKAINVPDAFAKSCENRLNRLNESQKSLLKIGMGNPLVTERLKESAARLAEKRYAEFDRLFHSKLFQLLRENLKNIENGFLMEEKKQKEMFHLRINCGSREYLKTGLGLFLPDRKWDGSAPYGYLSKTASQMIGRADSLPVTNALRQVFLTELYGISGYCFRVPSGKYTVNLYQRVGYEAGRKPGAFVVDISVNGKKYRKEYDIFTAESRQTGMAVLTITEISPENGLIMIEIKPSGERDVTVALLNGIELIKNKK